ncbi:transcription-repair coupling factor, partial [Candidatus Sumerlaeota bacterium]|nr:transcription-repair coupling factor [Candidatus Sumerlaeota bacterium]
MTWYAKAGAALRKFPARIQGLTRPAQAFLLANAFLNDRESFAIIVPDNATAERMAADLAFFLGGQENIIYLPQIEALPYEPSAPTPEIASARQSALYRLGAENAPYILVSAAAGMLQKCPKKSAALSFPLVKGKDVDRASLEDFLAHTGYLRADPVAEPGGFAFRGGVMDCWPPNENGPLRVEFFGDEVESIRRFNADTQRSLGHMETATLPPARETHYLGVDSAALFGRFENSGMEIPQRALLAVQNKMFFPGMEWYFPLFRHDSVTPMDYLPGNIPVVLCEEEKVAEHLEIFEKEYAVGYDAALEKGEQYCPPGAIFADKALLLEWIQTSPGTRLSEISDEPEGAQCVTFKAREAERLHGVFSRFIYDCRERLEKGTTVLFVCRNEETIGRAGKLMGEEGMGFERLAQGSLPEFLQSSRETPRLVAITGDLPEGFVLDEARLAVITEEEVFGRHTAPRREKRRRTTAFATDFSNVKPGDYVVHRDHGVGLYHGMKSVPVGARVDEYLEIEYAEDQRLFLPISSIHLLEKFSSAGGPRPTLDRMGGQTWARTKEKVKKGIMRMAKELLEIYAMRKMGRAYAFAPDGNFHRDFADTFGFVETPDQAQAILDVAADMEADKPMDRLVCGDVGYGKTEVAMRAAFKAAVDGRQTAVLAPTTLLANQHLANFKNRMAPFGIKVEMLSRFVQPKLHKEILARMAAGDADVIIGTHKILQKDVVFARLGLVIIDEEHRFGVAHKERLKKLRETVDVLTLTATPIPRTLHMSISGIRDISVINTPPPERHSITTFVRKFNAGIIAEALNRELARGGQIFFLHNSVNSIYKMATWLKKLVPSLRAEVAHGQMSGRELEEIMEKFIRRKTDMLVCTTIIESGLDIPNANTIIVNRADKFGLAQLYQLRGRVGRGKHRAYAFMLVPPNMGPVAKKRIKAIEELSDLGSGFKLAARDMEIRGAGNLLGPQQSGNITAVGFETYCRMLEEAVEEIRSGKGEIAPRRAETALSLDFAGRLEEAYIPSLEQRMDFYYRLHRSEEMEEARQLAEELEDRFGPMPEKAQKVVDAVLIKIAAIRAGLEKLELAGGELSLTFPPSYAKALEIVADGAAFFKGRVVGVNSGNRITLDIS